MSSPLWPNVFGLLLRFIWVVILSEQDEEQELDAIFDKILQDFSSFNITEHEMHEFLNSDNENSLEYMQSIMEDVSDLVNGEAVQNANIESSDDKTEASQSMMNWCVLLDLMIFMKKFLPWGISLSARSLKMEWVRIIII